MTMTSKVKPYKFSFGPFAPEVYRMPFGDTAGPEKLKEVFVKHVNPEAVACVVAEPVQGEGGFITPPPGYFQELAGSAATTASSSWPTRSRAAWAARARCSRSSTGKASSPTSSRWPRAWGRACRSPAVVGRAEIMDAVHPGGLGGTYGANPVACAAALAVLEVFEEEDMLGKSQALGRSCRPASKTWPKKFPVVGVDPGHRRHAGAGARQGRAPRARGGRGQEARGLLPGARPDHPGVRHLQQRHPRAGAVRDHGRRTREGSRDPGAGT